MSDLTKLLLSERGDLSSDMSLLPDDAKDHPAYAAFVQEMEGHAYGHTLLNTVWYFFSKGYEADHAQSSAFEAGWEAGLDFAGYACADGGEYANKCLVRARNAYKPKA